MEPSQKQDCAIHFWVYWEALQAMTIKVPHLPNTATSKYQRIIRFAVNPHSIYIQAHRDPDKQWLPMAYKITDAELEVIVQYWLVDWHEPVSAKDISLGPRLDAPDEKFQARKDLHEFDRESLMESDPESQHMLEELCTKICMDYNDDNSSHSMMENQLHQIIKVVTNASDAAVQAMRVSS